MRVLIDASRIHSGGGEAHLIGLVGALDPSAFGIRELFVVASKKMIGKLSNIGWVKPVPFQYENSSIIFQIAWQRFSLRRLCQAYEIDLLINVDAGSVANYETMITISQDLQSFEPGIISGYPVSYQWLRLKVLKYVQLSALRRADVAVFLTKYARDLIQRETGHLEKVRIIGHGINEVDHCGNTLDESHRPPKVVYVSNIAPYKNHDYVLDALAELRRHGLEIQLTLIGGGADGPYLRKTLGKIANLRREGYRIETLPKLAREEVIGIVKNSDVFLFASSCESMPVTLLEGMKLGIPVACSNQGPMPEILREGGWYFHPKMPGDIARTVREILLSSREERDRRKGIATAIANGYTWHNTARKTWSLVFETLQSKKP